MSESENLGITPETIGPALEMMDKLTAADKAPEAKQDLLQVADTPVSLGYHVCAHCKKAKVLLQEMPQVKSSLVGLVPDAMCPECLKLFTDYAYIVCVGCKALVSKLPPYRTGEGFEVLKNQTYHIPACPVCDPQVTKTQLLEYLHFRKLKSK